MPLCHDCLKIDFAAVLRANIGEHLSWSEGYPSHNDMFYCSLSTERPLAEHPLVPFHTMPESLPASADNCGLCRLVLDGYSKLMSRIHDARELGFKWLISDTQLWISNIRGMDGFHILCRRNDQRAHESVARYVLVGAYGLCVEKVSPLANILQGRTIPASPVDPSVLGDIKRWVSRCSEQRGHLGPEGRPLPTRVLSIRNGGARVMLYESNGTAGEYASLSYCWGTAHPTTLTSSTLDSLRAGINTSDLPQTLRDAIWLAHQLGIPYIWIDSLCIVQDDNSDWARESARMCDTYANSALTIAASRAAASSEGFLGDRDDRTYIPVPFQGDGGSGEALAFEMAPRTGAYLHEITHMGDEPLTARGWAMQERYLSPRTIHFGQSQIYFECTREFTTEDRCARGLRPIVGKEEMGVWHPESWGDWIRVSWYDAVGLYSSRALSYETDKLPTVAGLAAHFLSTFSRPGDDLGTKGQYLAGLWREDLIRGLRWRTHDRAPPGSRPPTYRAPTWSWASMDGKIYHFPHSDFSSTDLAVVQDVQVDVESLESPFGRVTGGHLLLRAIVLRPRMEPGDRVLNFCEDGVKFHVFPSWDAESYDLPEGDGSLERGAAETEPGAAETELFAIPLSACRQDFDGRLWPFFLILKAVDHHVHAHASVPGFQRVGAGTAQEFSRSPRGLERLAETRWAVAEERGDMEDVLIV